MVLKFFMKGDYVSMWMAFDVLPWGMLSVFLGGVVIGLIGFSKLLKRLKTHYHDTLMATLLGIILGSMHTIWPWKKVVSTYLNSKGEEIPLIQQNILPPDMTSLFR
jgi:putative membrane protein